MLLDYAVLPAGRTVAQVNPNGNLLMGATAFTGTLTDWQPTQTALTNAPDLFNKRGVICSSEPDIVREDGCVL